VFEEELQGGVENLRAPALGAKVGGSLAVMLRLAGMARSPDRMLAGLLSAPL
jgi:hypothetical protein